MSLKVKIISNYLGDLALQIMRFYAFYAFNNRNFNFNEINLRFRRG